MTTEPATSKLKQWRLDAERTQEDCAEEIGVTRQTWIEWELLKRVPSAPSMRKLRRLTGGQVTADDFYPPLCDAA